MCELLRLCENLNKTANSRVDAWKHLGGPAFWGLCLQTLDCSDGDVHVRQAYRQLGTPEVTAYAASQPEGARLLSLMRRTAAATATALLARQFANGLSVGQILTGWAFRSSTLTE